MFVQYKKSRYPSTGIAATLILLLFILTVGLDLFHNHEPAFFDNDDCPALHLNLLLTAAQIALFLWFIFFYVKIYLFISFASIAPLFPINNSDSRAPPFSN